MAFTIFEYQRNHVIAAKTDYDMRGEKAAREAADKLMLKKDAGEVTK